ncbi:DUF2868 domain-containing protein [Pseudohalioglobus sediminis]|uniref:DUF2868 domain-containing protein n=1 Tax=Pseudohalioglobus sediminis TaxID=2606449 RepID=A0A5B0WZR7_9GAMM|nr:DUF2868 domain-containing protein [Pseudohalioglobus sediminis]KAA1192552.1 DUF2868 domain-containing protein [Pseudohalioglobus sediminis]
MPASAPPVKLIDLYRLAEQMEADRDVPASALRERDHRIGQRHGGDDDASCLLAWLDQVAPREPQSFWLTQSHIVLLLRALALLAGAMALAGFLLASERALVNVLLFQLFFVLLPLLLGIVAAVVMLRSVRGSPPAISPLNPAGLVVRRAVPGPGELREAGAAMRLLALRYGQELGALFAAGVMFAFLVLLAFTDFSFVWGSTFGFSDQAIDHFNALLAWPWSSWLPQAVVPAEVVTDTRYHAAQLDFSAISAASRRGWWPFLLMCLATYALLPRLLLWLLSRYLYRRELLRSFVNYPGAAAALARMRSPVVKTQAAESEHVDVQPYADVYDDSALLLDWADALAGGGVLPEQLARPQNHLRAGCGSPAEDVDCVEAINRRQPDLLLVAVKSWEPPMADLADVLADVRGVSRCRLLLVPLKGREVSEQGQRDWKAFAVELPFAMSDAQPLEHHR